MKFKSLFTEVRDYVSAVRSMSKGVWKDYRKEILVLTVLGAIGGMLIGKTICTRLSIDFDAPTVDDDEGEEAQASSLSFFFVFE